MGFLHNLKYAFKTLLKNKTVVFWTLLFPIGLATFMYMAFGNVFENDELFSEIPVAVIVNEKNEGFEEVLSQLSKGDDKLIKIVDEDKDKADELLKNGEITGIIYVASEPSLKVSKETYESTILKTILEEYDRAQSVAMDVASVNPEAVTDAIKRLSSDTKYHTEKTSSHGIQNQYYSYFYAIFAMSCLFSSFAGADRISKLQANESALGMRRCLVPTSKLTILFAEFTSMLLVQFVIECLALVYMTLIGIKFGDRYPALLLILFVGSAIGIAIGAIVGSFANLDAGRRQGICVAIGMISSVLADLTVSGIKDMIEHKLPIINRINPASLISDAFYALNVYEDYSRYARNMITLSVMALIMIFISFLLLRRNKYASV